MLANVDVLVVCCCKQLRMLCIVFLSQQQMWYQLSCAPMNSVRVRHYYAHLLQQSSAYKCYIDKVRTHPHNHTQNHTHTHTHTTHDTRHTFHSALWVGW
jgi:hypothetical protein